MTCKIYKAVGSSYHSVFSIFEPASIEKLSIAIKRAIGIDFYVGDIFTGAASDRQATEMQNEFFATLRRVHFDTQN